MLSHVSEHVDRFAEALKETPEYRGLEEAREAVESREAARIMLRDFRRLQRELDEKQLSGEAPTEEEARRWQQQLDVISMNPYVRAYLEAEIRFAELWMAVQARLADALGLAAPGAEGGDEGGAAEAASAAAGQGADGSRAATEAPHIVTPKPKIWTPGS